MIAITVPTANVVIIAAITTIVCYDSCCHYQYNNHCYGYQRSIRIIVREQVPSHLRGLLAFGGAPPAGHNGALLR